MVIFWSKFANTFNIQLLYIDECINMFANFKEEYCQFKRTKRESQVEVTYVCL